MSLADVAQRTAELAVACSRCDRVGRYGLDTLIARHGPAMARRHCWRCCRRIARNAHQSARMIFAASTAPTCRSCFSDRADAMRRGSRPRRRQAYWITCLARAKAHRSRSPSRSPIADHRSQGNSHHTPTAFGAGRRVGGWRAPSHCLVNEILGTMRLDGATLLLTALMQKVYRKPRLGLEVRWLAQHHPAYLL